MDRDEHSLAWWGGTCVSESSSSVKNIVVDVWLHGRAVGGDLPKQPARQGHLGGGLCHWTIPTTVFYPVVLFLSSATCELSRQSFLFFNLQPSLSCLSKPVRLRVSPFCPDSSYQSPP